QYRNELPPRLIDETEIKLDVDGDKPATQELSFSLPGEHRGSDMEGNWTLGHYTVIVIPRADAKRFHALIRNSSSKNGYELESAFESPAQHALHAAHQFADAEVEGVSSSGRAAE